MIVHISNLNQFLIWIPLSSLNETTIFSVPAKIFMSFFMFFSTISAFLIGIMTYLMWKVPKFHLNNKIIWSMFFLCWYFMFFGCSILQLYEYGVLTVDDNGPYIGDLEEDDNVTIALTRRSFPCFFASILIWTYLSFITSTGLFFLVERTIATFWFRNYEKKRRIWLTCFLVLSILSCTILQSYLLISHIFTIYNSMICCSIIICFVVPYFFYLKYQNIRVREEIKKGNVKYQIDLTSKFQLEENIRFMNLTNRVVVTFFAVFGIFIVLMIAAFFNILSSQATILYLKVILTLNPLIIVPTILNSDPEWRERAWKALPFTNKSKNSHRIQVKMVSNEDIGRVYFDQFQYSWK